jgi:hypothetical protein
MDQVWRANAPDVISESIEGETIILHLGNGFYFSAGGAGALAWQLLSDSVPVSRTTELVASAYETEGVDVAGAVDGFVEELRSEGLLVPAEPGTPASEGTAATGPRLSWEAPTLSKFTDMEDLLLLDPVHEVSPQQGWPYAAQAGGAAV